VGAWSGAVDAVDAVKVIETSVIGAPPGGSRVSVDGGSRGGNGDERGVVEADGSGGGGDTQ
jgi:hypothetical protein